MTKNNDKVLIALILLAISITGLIFYMTYFLIPPFNSDNVVKYVYEFNDSGGFRLSNILLGLVVTFTLIYIYYIIVDNNEIEVYMQGGKPQLYKKDNLLSASRIYQYYTIVSGLILVIRNIRRITKADDIDWSKFIFRSNIIMLMWDVVFILFVVMVITLIIEYFNKKRTIMQ